VGIVVSRCTHRQPTSNILMVDYVGVWDGFRFQFLCGLVVYKIKLHSFKNILTKCLLKAYSSNSMIFWST
jgi:hypothetical protein